MADEPEDRSVPQPEPPSPPRTATPHEGAPVADTASDHSRRVEDDESVVRGDFRSRVPSPHPPGSSASVAASIADSVETATPTLGTSAQTQVNVVNRGFTPADKPNPHQFYANLPAKRHGNTDADNESMISRSTAQRTNISSSNVGGHRRPPSRSHVPAIMPAYSFYHPLRPPAVASASGQEQIAQTPKAMDDQPPVVPGETPSVNDEISSVHGKPSTEALLPKPPAPPLRTEFRPLHPVAETASNRTSMHSTQLLGANAPVVPPAPTPQPKQKPEVPKLAKHTRNWEHFPGKTRYHLGGRVQFGTQYWANIGTAALILIPTSLYFAFTYVLSWWS